MVETKDRYKYEISVIIPAYKEGGEVRYFLNDLFKQLDKLGKKYEVLFIDNNTSENSEEVVKEFAKKHHEIKYYQLLHPGVSVVDKANKYVLGFKLAQGRIILHLDADGQDRPEEIAKFIEKIEEGYDMVVGYKKERKDPFLYKFPSKVLNSVIRILTGTNVHDMNNGFKAYKAEVAKSLNLYSGNFRYIPIILHSNGYKITEVPVKHIPRKYGKGKFNFLSRVKGGVFDLLSTLLIVFAGKTPIYFYGKLSALLGLIGLIGFSIGILHSLPSIQSTIIISISSILTSLALSLFLFGIALENSKALTLRNHLEPIIVKKL